MITNLQSQNLNTITSSMTKNKNVLKVYDFLSEFSARNLLKVSNQINTVENFENSVVLEDIEFKFMNLKISK